MILLILEELKKIQKRCGYLKEKELVRLSEKLGIPLVKIYETGSFYSFLSTKPKGKYVIRVCNNLPCIANGSGKILEYLKKILKIRIGETTRNGKFSLETTSCIGCCDKPPAMMINEKVYTSLDEKKIKEIIRGLK